MEVVVLTALYSCFVIGLLWLLDVAGLLPDLRGRAEAIVKTMRMPATEPAPVFQQIGLTLSIEKYRLGRLCVLTPFFLAALLLLFFRDLQAAGVFLLLGGAAGWISWPEGRAFKNIIKQLRRNYLKKKDDELLTLIIQLQNLIVSQQERPCSADYLVQSIMRFSKLTRPAFSATLTLLRLGRSDEVYDQFAGTFGTRLGEDFAGILIKLDALPPIEFLEQLQAFLAQTEEVRKTEAQRRQQLVSTIMFSLASVQVLLIIMNFIVLTTQYSLQALY